MTGLERWAMDVRLAVRKTARRPGFTAAVVTCLGLGIGATTGVFSVLHPVLVGAVPFAAGDRLYQVSSFDVQRTDPELRYWISHDVFDHVRRESRTLDALAGFVVADLDVYEGEESRRIAGAREVPESFTALGVQPLLGRDIRGEDLVEGRRTALISESLWSARLARDPGVLGCTLNVQGRRHTIVGVVPDRVRLPGRADLWVIHDPDDLTERERMGAGNEDPLGKRVKRGAWDGTACGPGWRWWGWWRTSGGERIWPTHPSPPSTTPWARSTTPISRSSPSP